MVYKVTEETITGIANAIRTQTNSTEDIQVEDFAEEILSIKTVKDAEAAAKSASEAEGYMVSAKSSAEAAALSAKESALFTTDSEAWAVGTRDGVDIADAIEHEAYENNAKHYATKAEESAESAKSYRESTYAIANNVVQMKTDITAMKADISQTVEEVEGFRSEAFAVGTRDGVAVVDGEEGYQNNAKYYMEQTQTIVNNFSELTVAGNVFIEGATYEEVTS